MEIEKKSKKPKKKKKKKKKKERKRKNLICETRTSNKKSNGTNVFI